MTLYVIKIIFELLNLLFIVLFYLPYSQCMESSEINIQKYLSKLITSRIDIKTAK